ncbi:cell division protein FtsL [Bacillus sp. 31A1R]|uniref:Cell division protein FtsL n=1 Tax=Robertmurraya mangrovi TaxID=3098077 RepID=A0ABU5IU76_9BACI|nr:cell division protein FtsL [Bacillus sp. 31A1R]MDZ5470694.1 cell division protein FtsL [Bacillus sp. 31A1R]
MSNLARKLQQEQEQVQQTQYQTVQAPKKSNKFKLSPGEKVLGLTFCAIVCYGAVTIIGNQSDIYQVNKDIQSTKVAIQEQTRANNDLEMQVSELKTYERIWAKAKELGLKLSEDNVKVVQD